MNELSRNVHCVANVGLRKRLNLCKRGFKIYDLLVFRRFVCDQTQIPARPALNLAICNVSTKVVETKIYDYAADILTVFLILCKIYPRVGFIEALDSKGIINTQKRYVMFPGKVFV